MLVWYGHHEQVLEYCTRLESPVLVIGSSEHKTLLRSLNAWELRSTCIDLTPPEPETQANQ